MSQIDRNPNDYIMPPRKLAERLAAVNGRANGSDDATASSMAQRFAPELQVPPAEAIKPSLEPLRVAMPEPMIAQAAQRGFWTRPLLAAALTATALVPGSVLGVLIWQGVIAPPWSSKAERQGSGAVQASLAASPAAVALPKGDAKVPEIALTAPESIETEPGKDVPFIIAVDSDRPLPARSTITISGLAQGMTFSEGRPFGDTEWSLRTDEVGDLKLRLPETASGERELGVALVSADGTTLAKTSARLDVTEQTKAPLVLRPEEADRVADLISHGRKMIEVGYLAGARSYYRRAAEAGSGEAAFALAATYDPALIEEMGAQGIKPDEVEARTWYERAKALGAANADAQLARLNSRRATPAIAPEPGPAPQMLAVASESAVVPTAAVPASEEWVEIAGSANLRDGPSSNAAALKVVHRGSKYRVTGRQGGWVHVLDPATQESGWVYTRYLAGSVTP